MALKDWLELTRTVLNLTDDLKKSREEIKNLSSQVHELTAKLLVLQTKFDYFTEKEFQDFAEKEALKRAHFEQAEKHEREKFIQRIDKIVTDAESLILKQKVEALSRQNPKKRRGRQFADRKSKS